MIEPVEGTAVEVPAEHDHDQPGTSLAPATPALAVTPQVNAAELVTRLDVIREAMTDAMERDVDYGVIPGTDKPALLKPGAEKLAVLFQLDVQLENEKEWGPGEHLTVTSKATVYHAPSGARLGYGEGVCTTRERKYAKRQQNRACPACGREAIIKGKAEYGGGWVCFKKKGGCGAKYQDGDPVVEGQQVGEIENPDLPDLWNTAVKMAEKRARVDAVLAVTGASALFTQDVEPAPDAASTVDGASSPAAAEPQDDGKASPSQVRMIYEAASGKLTNAQLFNLALEAKGAPPQPNIDEDTATRLRHAAVQKIPADKVADVLLKIADHGERELGG